MPLQITHEQATPELRRAWDRLAEANNRLDKYLEDRVGDRDAIVDEQIAAAEGYRRAARAAGYVGTNGRTKPPHIISTP